MLTEATEIIQILLLSNITIQVNHDKIILYAIVFFCYKNESFKRKASQNIKIFKSENIKALVFYNACMLFEINALISGLQLLTSNIQHMCYLTIHFI